MRYPATKLFCTWREFTPKSSSNRLFLILVLYISGCGSLNHELKQQIASEAASLPVDVSDDEAVIAAAESVLKGETNTSTDVPLPAKADLERYIVLALERNPSIHRMVRQLQVLGFKVEQVTSLEDPMFNLTPPTNNMTETAAGMMDASLGISQKLPFPGRLSRRGRVAEQEVRMAIADLADARIQIANEVARAHYEHYLAHVSIEITKESQKLLEQIRDVASARYQAGDATQQDVLRAEVEQYALLNDLLTFQQQEISAKAKLNTLMNRAVDAEIPSPSALQLETIEWQLPDLLNKALLTNPKLSKLKEEMQHNLEAIKLAQLDYYPDFRIGFSYNIIGSGISPVASGDDNWSIPLGLNLPIWWQRIRAGINESNARTLSTTEQFEEMKNIVFFGLQDTLTKIDTQYRQAALFRDLIVPRALQAVEVSTANYRAGDIEFTALVENWRNWLKFSLAFHRTLAGLEQRFADLQQLVGASIPRREESTVAKIMRREEAQELPKAKTNGGLK